MFTQELKELYALTEIDRIGKEYYDQTGEYLSGKVIDPQMIRRLIEIGGLHRYIKFDTDRIEVLIDEASAVLNQEKPFFSPEKAFKSFLGTRTDFKGFNYKIDRIIAQEIPNNNQCLIVYKVS